MITSIFINIILIGYIGWQVNSSYFGVFDMDKGVIINSINVFDGIYNVQFATSDGQGTIFVGN